MKSDLRAMQAAAKIPTIVLGGTGYVAGDLLRLMASHPQLELKGVLSDSQPGEPLAKSFVHLAPVYPELKFSDLETITKLATSLPQSAIVSAAPHGVAAKLIDDLLTAAEAKGAEPRVILAWPRDSHEAASIAREAAKVPALVPVFLGPAAAGPTALALAGDAAAVVRTVTLRLPVADDLWDHDPLTPVIRDFRREIQARTGRPHLWEGAAGPAGRQVGRSAARPLGRGVRQSASASKVWLVMLEPPGLLMLLLMLMLL